MCHQDLICKGIICMYNTILLCGTQPCYSCGGAGLAQWASAVSRCVESHWQLAELNTLAFPYAHLSKREGDCPPVVSVPS